MSETGRTARWLLALAVVSLLPNLAAALPTAAYYFRDFSLTFYPQRFYFAKELASGRWPFWNPDLYEGSAVLPFYYPIDLLHVLWPSPVFVSWLLTLHLPLAALAMYALARELGAARGGAFVAGALYATGGLALSSLSLFIFLEALAWAPLAALLLRRAAVSGGRGIPLAALAIGISISTLAVEFAVQGVLLGIALGVAAQPNRRGLLRVSAACALGTSLAGLPILLTSGIVAESLRAGGLTAFEALQRSVHPLSLLQTVVADAFGPPSEPFQLRFWNRLFADGPPYFTTYYVGPAALVLAAAGSGALRRRERAVLLAALGLALLYALGRHAWLAPAFAAHVRFFRFPVKALLTPYLVATLLAGMGATRLAAGAGRHAAAAAGALLAGTTGALGLVLLSRPDVVQGFLEIDDGLAAQALPLVMRSAVASTAIALAASAVAAASRLGSLAGARGAALLAILAIGDVVRAGAGVNPQVPAGFYDLLPEIRGALQGLGEQRAFSYGTTGSPAINELLVSRRPGLHLQTYFLARQVLTPFVNLIDGVPLAEGADRHGFIPNQAALKPSGYDPAAFASVLPALRNAGVGRVLSLDQPQDPALRLSARVETGIPGRTIQVYELADPWPRAFVACSVRFEPDRGAALQRALQPDYDPTRDVVLEAPGRATCSRGTAHKLRERPDEQHYEVELEGDGYLVIRDGFAPSWRSDVDGRAAPLLRANGRHRAVPLTSGRHAVRVHYEPPRLRAGLLATALGVLATALLLVRPPRAEP